ncbi:hypothetical protein D9M72_571820 [compost metagenome]
MVIDIRDFNLPEAIRSILEAAAPHMQGETSQDEAAAILAQDIRTTPAAGAFNLAEPIANHLSKLGYRKVTK